LTVHLGTIFVNNQLDAQLFFMYVYFYSLHVSGKGTLLVAQLVEALRYKPEGRGFNSPWVSMVLGSTQPLTEMSTRNVFWG
jgi:hypothetical protein